MSTEYRLRNAKGETSAWLYSERSVAILKAQGWEVVETRTTRTPQAPVAPVKAEPAPEAEEKPKRRGGRPRKAPK